MDKKRILFIRLTALGDTILTLGMVEYLYNLGYEIDFVTDWKWAPILAEQKYINAVYSYKKGEFTELEASLAANNYDVVIDLQQKLKTLKLLFSLKAKIKATTSIKYRIYRHLFKKVKLHTIEKYLTSITKLGVYPKFEEVLPRVEVSDSIVTEVKEKYSHIFADNKVIAVNPFASRPTKHFPWDKLEIILAKLDNLGYKIIIMGIDSEIKSIGDSYFTKYEKVAESNILYYCAMIQLSTLLITNDSGPKQISDAVGTKSVVFWGPTHPKTGFGVYNGYDLYSKIECSPCSLSGEKECKHGDYRCFDYYTVDKISHFITDVALKNI